MQKTKQDFLSSFHKELAAAAPSIAASGISQGEKAKQVNLIANTIKQGFVSKVESVPLEDRANYLIILQYCFSVVSLEYRHAVWQYEYMAFSRRVGELWEAFCSAAWDYPSRPNVERIAVPDFSNVRQALLDRLNANVGAHPKKDEIAADIATLFEIIGEINMREDEVFSVENVPHVIDFKSGFGSNEKGNMLRLQTVGRAYRIWNHSTRLMLLVRQEENNNYLRVLLRSGLWEVHTGAAAYKMIAELTGADMTLIRKEIVAWESDLSPGFYRYLRSQATDLTSYLNW